MKYLYPNKPNRIAPHSKFFNELDKDKAWVAEVKKNGWRCLAEKDGRVNLWTRHKTLITDALLEIRNAVMSLPNNTVLDGELVFTRRVKGVPDFLYLFDVIYHDGKVMVEYSLRNRRKILEKIYRNCLAGFPKIVLAEQIRIGKKELYEQAKTDEINEGIVLKKLSSRECLLSYTFFLLYLQSWSQEYPV